MAELLPATREQSMLHRAIVCSQLCYHALPFKTFPLIIIKYIKHQGCRYSYHARRESMAQHAMSFSRDLCPRFSLRPRQKVHFLRI